MGCGQVALTITMAPRDIQSSERTPPASLGINELYSMRGFKLGSSFFMISLR